MFKYVTTAALSAVLATAAMADGSKVGLVPGGPHPFFADWEPGGLAAQKDFGLEAGDFKVPQKWELNLQNDLLLSMVVQGYDAFVVHPGDPVGSAPTLNEIVGTGSPVVIASACLKDPSDVAFCIATEARDSAYRGTKKLIESMGDGPKKIVHFAGWLVEPNTQLRIEGVERAVAEHDSVEIFQVIADIDAPEPAEEKISAYMAAYGSETDGIITTGWVPTVVAANALRKDGSKRIKMVGIDHDPVVVQAIKDGYVVGSMLQNPYGQSYIAAFAADRLRSGCSVKDDAPFTAHPLTARFIDSGAPYLHAGNVEDRAAVDEAMTKELLSTFEETYLDC
ncbi:sugar ABC transporter substrate-binding protein [uncultured Ruegeria sp.]|uniref:sugar ABC transporter substrate-binding protein n=1 Tax=uncultured Ruegeria sp. TaxID=259304 RepID=UPI00262B83B2|nr:sugar ABC transporter substrate-binding protein [uncultured Ruegeria sp.]